MFDSIRFAPRPVPTVNGILGSLSSPDDMEYGFWSVDGNGQPVAVPPFALAFSTQALGGHALAAADEEGVVTVLDTRRPLKEQMLAASRASGPIARFLAHDNAIFDLIWMKNDSLVATASGDATVRVFDVETKSRSAMLRGHSGSAKCIRALPTMPNVLMSAARDGNVRAFDLRVPSVCDRVSREEYHAPVFTIHQPHVPASNHASAPGTARKRRRVRAEQPKLSHSASVTSLAFYPDNDSMLYTAGAADGTVKLWDLRNIRDAPRSACSLKHSNILSAVCVSSVTPGSEERRDNLPRARRTHGIAHVDLDAQGRHLLVSSTDSTIYLYNAKNLSLGHSRVLTGHAQTSFYIRACFSPDGRHVLSGSADAKAYIWDVEATAVGGAVHPILELEGHHGGEASAVDWCTRDPLKLATCADDSTAKVWTVDMSKRPLPALNEGESGCDENRYAECRARLTRPKVRKCELTISTRVESADRSSSERKNRLKNSDIRTFFRPCSNERESAAQIMGSC